MSFFFKDTATTEIYTLSLHDALPILPVVSERARVEGALGGEGVATASEHALDRGRAGLPRADVEHGVDGGHRSEEHTSELQSRRDLVCRLLLEKKKKKTSKYVVVYP